MELRKRDIGRAFRIGVFPVPGFALMSYACTVEPFRAANLLSGAGLYDIVHFAQTPLAASSGAAQVERSFDMGETPPLDLLIVVAGGDPFAFDDPTSRDWLQRMARQVPLIGGVSGGPVLLARAGLMAGRRMTVHWEHGPEMAERYPDALIERRLYVIDRDRVTCGGGTAPLDLMHAVIAGHHGQDFARRISDWFLHTDIRAATAPQRAGVAERIGNRSAHLLAAVAAMEDHIADPLSLSQLALVAEVSARHLNRLFVDALGQSAMRYYRDLRLQVARRLIGGSTLSVGEVAQATGFATAADFSNAYRAHYGAAPLADRHGISRISA